ncbi:hypothetical protein KSS87_004399 [Heliosperma pusillum]|nr:hypothetical protein KSS87_004399 [Heliosperma pusillum]
MHKSNVLAAIELVAIKFCIFFWLPEYVGLKHDTSFLSELPDGYKFETALADLIDNSLQAVWSNGKDERMFISPTLTNTTHVITCHNTTVTTHHLTDEASAPPFFVPNASTRDDTSEPPAPTTSLDYELFMASEPCYHRHQHSCSPVLHHLSGVFYGHVNGGFDWATAGVRYVARRSFRVIGCRMSWKGLMVVNGGDIMRSWWLG